MRKLLIASVMTTLTGTMAGGGQAKTFSIPSSVLLFGGPAGFCIVGPTWLERISIPPNPDGKPGPVALPDLSSSGTLVSSGFAVANDSADTRWGIRASVAVYTVREKRWRTYGIFSQIHTTAVSRDGSKVAFMADDIGSEKRSLEMLDLKTSEISRLKDLTAVSISWSPDGTRLALDIPYAEFSRIVIFNVATRSIQEVKNGSFPAWSPSGEWIAYVGASEQAIHLMHADGTDDHALISVKSHLLGYRSFGLQPVWSPDSARLLVNEYKGEGDTQDVLLVDVRTGNAETKCRNGDPVMAWASLAHREN